MALTSKYHLFLGLNSSVDCQWLLSNVVLSEAVAVGLGDTGMGNKGWGKGGQRRHLWPVVKVEHLQDNKPLPCVLNLFFT